MSYVLNISKNKRIIFLDDLDFEEYLIFIKQPFQELAY